MRELISYRVSVTRRKYMYIVDSCFMFNLYMPMMVRIEGIYVPRGTAFADLPFVSAYLSK